MSNYKEFRIEEINNGSEFCVQVKGFLGWKSGYVFTDYFKIGYSTKKEALAAIENYKNRFTVIK